MAAGLLLSIVFLLMAGFAASLAIAPSLPQIAFRSPRNLAALSPEYQKHALFRGHPRVRRSAIPAGAASRPLTVGFYVSWDERSRESLRDHVEQIDVLAPQWISLTGSDGEAVLTEDPMAMAVIRNSRRKPSLVPLVINARNEVWNGPMVEAMLADPKARARLISTLAQWARRGDWEGVGFDLEDLSPRAQALYPQFLKEARGVLGREGRQVWATAPYDDLAWPARPVQDQVDQLVLMAYDEHYGRGAPGPTAGQDWYEAHLARLSAVLDPKRTIMAIGAYGYDWTKGGGAEAVTFHEATQAAADAGAQIGFDPHALNPTFAYADDAGRAHEVWFLDATTAFNLLQVTDAWRPKGYALWRMGSEDPTVWTLFGRPYGGADPDGLSTLPPSNDVDYDGAGEILRVTGRPSSGRRTLTLDATGDLIRQVRYDRIPTAWTVQRLGLRPRQVALTFDDGPDGRWTPKILDILKREGVKASFFVIGENMQRRPDLVERALREGHDIGSHTYTHPNIGEIADAQVALELNATQRLFETITGRSIRLFRPPFFGDADPSTAREVEPLLRAQSLGYLNVGLRIDPGDWRRPTPEQIVAAVTQRLDEPGDRPGRVVLLHDSGGDRTATVKALPALIHAIRARGYEIVPVSRLAGMSAAQAMPPTTRDDLALFIDRLAFTLIRTIEATVGWLFVVAIALGLGRLLFLGVFSSLHWFSGFRPPAKEAADPKPLVTVLVPCFNEEAVIAASLERLLQSRWERLEVIVLDDGSRDRTFEEASRVAASDPRVQVVRFENGGKARALNRGLAIAQGSVIVSLDADTQFAPETLARLARWFDDPNVGAVAGNALVGNRTNIITRWQALEYVTAQNLERRALAVLGCVTVVPGAVGAWRREALDAVGGYPPDTLAEDQDLTIAVQRAGWKVRFDPTARAFTESPDTIRGLIRQRTRWSFGTLQCLWKHRAALFDPKLSALGFIALPQIWLFQIVLTVVAPLVDLAFVWSIVTTAVSAAYHPDQWSSDAVVRTALYWCAFVLVDLAAGLLGMAMESRAPWADVAWLPAQRFGYRQIMYGVVIRAVSDAFQGRPVGWGKLERRASVVMSEAETRATAP